MATKDAAKAAKKNFSSLLPKAPYIKLGIGWSRGEGYFLTALVRSRRVPKDLPVHVDGVPVEYIPNRPSRPRSL